MPSERKKVFKGHIRKKLYVMTKRWVDLKWKGNQAASMIGFWRRDCVTGVRQMLIAKAPIKQLIGSHLFFFFYTE